jgi:hypothetical protein
VIAPPLSRELDEHARDAGEAVVEACMGIRVADGLRQPCEVFEVEGAAKTSSDGSVAAAATCAGGRGAGDGVREEADGWTRRSIAVAAP